MIFELCFATSWQIAACLSEKSLCLAGCGKLPINISGHCDPRKIYTF
jgi:hypothetical protein